jgi:hypothetical protein
MFLLTRDTVLNPGALEIRSVPRRFLGRATLWPAGGPLGLWARVAFEVELWRYLAALLPFALAAVLWPQYAIGIAQAPLPMLIVVYLVEVRLLRIPKDRRSALVGSAEAERGLDLLAQRGRQLLARIAAGRGIATGGLHLVVEQSDLARVPPLTLVSVQAEAGPELLRLTRDERTAIRETLFAPPLTERDLLRINLAQNQMLRDVALEAATVSAHARLEALLVQRQRKTEGG